MKGVIVFRGKYKATKTYAEWIGGELAWPVLDAREATAQAIAKYDCVVAGSAVYIGKLLIKPWLKQNWRTLEQKKMFVFVVCATPPEEMAKLNEMMRSNKLPAFAYRAPVHYLHGRMIMRKLSWWDRVLLKMGSKLEKDPDTKRGMLTEFDAVQKKNIAPIINDVRRYTMQRSATLF